MSTGRHLICIVSSRRSQYFSGSFLWMLLLWFVLELYPFWQYWLPRFSDNYLYWHSWSSRSDIKTEVEVVSGNGYDTKFYYQGVCTPNSPPILNRIFNLSLKSGVFPSSWKMSVVIPVHKSGDVCNVNNYRPISLLCAFSKVFEMVIHTRVSYYFRRKFSSAQHGFLKGRSVETNLCSFLGYSVPIVLSRCQVDTVYFDMTKAFDKVNHDLLLLNSSHCMEYRRPFWTGLRLT